MVRFHVFIKMGKLKTAGLSNLPKIVSLENGDAEICSSASDSKALLSAACLALELGLEG